VLERKVAEASVTFMIAEKVEDDHEEVGLGI